MARADLLAQLRAHDLPQEACEIALKRFDDADSALDFLLDSDEGQRLCAQASLHQCVSEVEGALQRQSQLQQLLQQRASVNEALRHSHGDTPLMLAVRAAGNSQLPQRLLLVHELLLLRATPNAADQEGETALMEAVCMGDVALCRLLLDARADVAQRSRAGSTAQDFCSNVEVSQLIARWTQASEATSEPTQGPQIFAMDADDSPRASDEDVQEDQNGQDGHDDHNGQNVQDDQNGQDGHEEELLRLAQDEGTQLSLSSLAELLETKVVDPNCHNAAQEAALLSAVRSAAAKGPNSNGQRLALVRLLLQHLADPNIRDQQGETPLMEASCFGDLPQCLLLLEFRASLTMTSTSGATALQFAQDHDDVRRCFEALTSSQSSTSGQHEEMEKTEEPEFPEWLAGSESPYDASSAASPRRPPLRVARWSLHELAAVQNATAIRELLETSEGCHQINTLDMDGYSPLHLALLSPPTEDQLPTIRCLLAARANVDEKLLPLAAQVPEGLDVLRSLLAATGTGANEDDAALLRRLQQPEPTASASTASASTKREERTQVDMFSEGDVDLDGNTALHRCILAPPNPDFQENLNDTVKALLARSKAASVNARNLRGETALLLAVQRCDGGGRVKAMRQLMKANADSNLGDLQDTTPLLEAVRQGDVEVCRLLLDRGADATKRGAEGLNAVELTWQLQHLQLRELFQSQGLNPQDAEQSGIGVQLTLRHASTQLKRVITVPEDTCIRDIKKLLVRLTKRGSWRRLALLCPSGRALRDADALGARRELLVADAKTVTEQEVPEEEQWPHWSLEELQAEAKRRGLQVCQISHELMLLCLQQAKVWDGANAAELRADSMKRGLPESCDRQEVLQMLKQDLSWEHMGEDELREECQRQQVALPEERQETALLLRAMRSRLRQALRWQHLDTEQLRKACELRHFNTTGQGRNELLEQLRSFKVMPQPKASPKVEPRRASAKSSGSRGIGPATAREEKSAEPGEVPEDGGDSYPSWMSERVRKVCAKYPNFSGKFVQEMEEWSLQDVEMYLYSNGFLRPKKATARRVRPPRAVLRAHYQLLGLEEGANASEIRKAYRRLALIYHPDKNPEDPDAAAETFRRLAEAYEVLAANLTEEDVAG